MSRQIALFIFIAFIAWLFYRDRKLRPMTSIALWIPLLWVIIIGTRPISLWFADASLHAETLDDYLKGSPFDRTIFLVLFVAGSVVLIKRRRMLTDIFSENRLFFVFFIFCGISCLWSNYAFTSFKRYIKDAGNVIMVIIIITETKPEQALKAILARYTNLVIVLSVLFIKYIPEFGRYYSRWTYEVVYSGISTNKNGLGQIALICGTFLLWDFMTARTKDNGAPDKLDLFMRGIMLAMVIWLLYMAHSSTSTVCMLLGAFILFFLRSSFAKKQFRNLGTWTLGLLFLIVIIFTTPGLFTSFTGILGRDVTLTGRTDIWQALLAQPINPLLGEGYQSFWQTPAAAQLGEKMYFIPNQAHNGYLEVYIQTGLISLLLLIGAIIAAENNLKRGLLLGSTHAMLLFSYFITLLIHNLTEATINKMSIAWFILIIALLYYPRNSSTITENDNAEPVNSKIDEFSKNNPS
jgi:exopolysaccharide production protein ExoQ